jgi:hypothetical protein
VAPSTITVGWTVDPSPAIPPPAKSDARLLFRSIGILIDDPGCCDGTDTDFAGISPSSGARFINMENKGLFINLSQKRPMASR